MFCSIFLWLMLFIKMPEIISIRILLAAFIVVEFCCTFIYRGVCAPSPDLSSVLFWSLATHTHTHTWIICKYLLWYLGMKFLLSTDFEASKVSSRTHRHSHTRKHTLTHTLALALALKAHRKRIVYKFELSYVGYTRCHVS